MSNVSELRQPLESTSTKARASLYSTLKNGNMLDYQIRELVQRARNAPTHARNWMAFSDLQPLQIFKKKNQKVRFLNSSG